MCLCFGPVGVVGATTRGFNRVLQSEAGVVPYVVLGGFGQGLHQGLKKVLYFVITTNSTVKRGYIIFYADQNVKVNVFS